MSRKVMAAILAHRAVAPLLSIARQDIAQQCPRGRRAFLGRWNAHQGLGIDEEFPAEG
jgi:hypothetical protein